MQAKVLLPSPRLRHVVEYYFHGIESFSRASFDGLYSTPILECIVFDFGSAASSREMKYGDRTFQPGGNIHLFGQPDRPFDMAGSYNDFIVVKFRPLGLWKLTGIFMQQIANRIHDAEDIFGSAIRLLSEEMQESESTAKKVACLDLFLQKRLARNQFKLHSCIHPALTLLRTHQGNINIRELQSQTHTTGKSLQRAFANHLGMSPKLYARIIRYNFVKTAIEKSGFSDWGKIAYAQGYYDQSHFINEFKRFSGKTPLAYYSDRATRAKNLSELLNPATALVEV